MPEENPCEDFQLRIQPYQVEVACGGKLSVQVHLTAPKRESAGLELILPEGFSCAEPVRMLQKGEESCTFSIEAPDRPVRRARIGCRMKAGDKLFGTQAEMLVTVKEEMR